MSFLTFRSDVPNAKAWFVVPFQFTGGQLRVSRWEAGALNATLVFTIPTNPIA